MQSASIAISSEWLIENQRTAFLLRPTPTHLIHLRHAVAHLKRYERTILFVCSYKSSPPVKEYFVPYSRVVMHAGPLLKHVKPYVVNTSDPLVIVPIDDHPTAFNCVIDYINAHTINLSNLSISDCVRAALSCKKWKCVDVYVAILRYIIAQDRLFTPAQFAVSTQLLWLPKERTSFANYYFQNVRHVIHRMSLIQLVDLAFASYASNRLTLCNDVLRCLLQSNPTLTSTQVLSVLTFFQHIQVPPFMKHFLITNVGSNFHALNQNLGYDNKLLHSATNISAGTEGTYPLQPLTSAAHHDVGEETLYPRHLAPMSSVEQFWHVICRNGLADCLFNFLRDRKKADLPQLVDIVARYIEPRRESPESISHMLRSIFHKLSGQERLLVLDYVTTVDSWSKRAIMLVTSSCFLLNPVILSCEAHVPLTFRWATIGAEPLNELATLTAFGVTFNVQPRNAYDRSREIILTCFTEEISFFYRYKSVKYVAWIVDTNCCCDCLHLLRKRTSGTLYETFDGFTEDYRGMLPLNETATLLDGAETKSWRLRHRRDCTAQMNIKINVQRNGIRHRR